MENSLAESAKLHSSVAADVYKLSRLFRPESHSKFTKFAKNFAKISISKPLVDSGHFNRKKYLKIMQD